MYYFHWVSLFVTMVWKYVKSGKFLYFTHLKCEKYLRKHARNLKFKHKGNAADSHVDQFKNCMIDMAPLTSTWNFI